MMNVKELKIDDEFAALIMPMTDDEFGLSKRVEIASSVSSAMNAMSSAKRNKSETPPKRPGG